MNQMRANNNSSFGRKEKMEFDSIRRGINAGSRDRQRDIENKKKDMEHNYAVAAHTEYDKGNPGIPSVQFPKQEQLAPAPASPRYELPEQTDEMSRVRRGTIIGEGSESDAPDSAYEETGSTISKQARRIRQLCLISGFLFAIMAGLVYVSRRRCRNEEF